MQRKYWGELDVCTCDRRPEIDPGEGALEEKEGKKDPGGGCPLVLLKGGPCSSTNKNRQNPQGGTFLKLDPSRCKDGRVGGGVGWRCIRLSIPCAIGRQGGRIEAQH